MKIKLFLLLVSFSISVCGQEWKKVSEISTRSLILTDNVIYGYEFTRSGTSLSYISSTDQGLSWKKGEISHPDDKGKGFEILYFQPPCVFTHTSYSGIINSSFDMGKTWNSFQLKDYHPTIELNTDKTIVKVVRKVNDTYYAVCMKGIMKYNQGEKTWEFANGLKGYLDRDYEEEGVKVYNKDFKYVDIFSSGNELIVVETDMDYKNTLLSSTDNGLTWVKKKNSFSEAPCNENPEFRFISEEGKLYFWGIEGCLAMSEDNGNSFKLANTVTEFVNAVFPGKIIVVGGYSDGTNYVPEITYSTDKGNTFKKLKNFSTTQDIPTGVILVNNNRIVVSIHSGIWIYNL